MQRQLTTLALTLAAAATLVTAAARAGEPQGKQEKQEDRVQRMVIVHGAPGEHAAALPDAAQIPGDYLRVDDLASYGAGESRSYTSESGAEVTITRAKDGGERYTLGFNGKQIEIGGTPEELALAGTGGMGRRIVIRHQDKAGGNVSEDVEEKRTLGGLPPADLLVAGDGRPPLVVEIVGEKDGKATRQVIVLKSVEKAESN
ncbi:MAG TPA: hypothetical protein VN923_14315 [Thermoanaerobaculia bacterium]|nr:hypothetical protein [Thermoanaerobaculia bacterium]